MRAALLRRRRRSLADPTFITTWQTTTAAESITLPLISSGTYDFEVDWGDGSTDTITTFDDAARIHEYAEAGTRDVRISGQVEGWNFYDVATSKDAILDVKNWGEMRLGASAPDAFRDCTNLDVTAADAPDLTGVTELSRTFIFSALSGGDGFGKWNVGGISSFLELCVRTDFNADISKWDMSAATNTRSMLREIPFNQDISGWDVSSVTTMQTMFWNSPVFNQPIGSWDVSNVTQMFLMLFSASSFNQNLGGWKLRRAGVDMEDALVGTALSPENYSRTLIGWANYVASSPGGPFDVTFGAGTLTYNDTIYEAGETYTNAVDARAYLTTATLDDGAGWTITDGGLA